MSSIKEAHTKAVETAKVFLEILFEGIVEDNEFAIVVKYDGSAYDFWQAELKIHNPGFLEKEGPFKGEEKFVYSLANLGAGLGDSPEDALECLQAIMLMRLEERSEKIQELIKENRELFGPDYWAKKEEQRNKRIEERKREENGT